MPDAMSSLLPRTVRPSLVWPALVARLQTHPRLTALMPDVIPSAAFIHRERQRAARGPEGAPWARVIVVPVINAVGTVAGAGQPDTPGEIASVPFLVRVDVNAPDTLADYDPQATIEAVHDAVYAALVGWAPTVEGVRVAYPIWREAAPPPAPLLLDEDASGVVFGSAVYRAGLVPAPFTAA